MDLLRGNDTCKPEGENLDIRILGGIPHIESRPQFCGDPYCRLG